MLKIYTKKSQSNEVHIPRQLWIDGLLKADTVGLLAKPGKLTIEVYNENKHERAYKVSGVEKGTVTVGLNNRLMRLLEIERRNQIAVNTIIADGALIAEFNHVELAIETEVEVAHGITRIKVYDNFIEDKELHVGKASFLNGELVIDNENGKYGIRRYSKNFYYLSHNHPQNEFPWPVGTKLTITKKTDGRILFTAS